MVCQLCLSVCGNAYSEDRWIENINIDQKCLINSQFSMSVCKNSLRWEKLYIRTYLTGSQLCLSVCGNALRWRRMFRIKYPVFVCVWERFKRSRGERKTSHKYIINWQSVCVWERFNRVLLCVGTLFERRNKIM
jgi:hypothetical protein